MGIPAARPLPRQELLRHDLAVGRHARSVGAVPDGTGCAAGRRSSPATLSARPGGPGDRRARHRARGLNARPGPRGEGTAPATIVAWQRAPSLLDAPTTRDP